MENPCVAGILIYKQWPNIGSRPKSQQKEAIV